MTKLKLVSFQTNLSHSQVQHELLHVKKCLVNSSALNTALYCIHKIGWQTKIKKNHWFYVKSQLRPILVSFLFTLHPTIHGICYIGFGKPFSASFSQLESLQNACIYSIAYELTVRGHANCSENEPVHK